MALAAIACDGAPKPGGECPMAEEGKLLACESASVALRCRDLRLEPVGCKGPKGCAPAGDQGAHCDRTVAAEGDVCWEDGDDEKACTSDARTLRCVDGRFTAVRACRGPKGCNALGIPPEQCDQTVAKAGDRCNTSGPWEEACSVDRKAILKCHDTGKPGKPDGEFRQASECPTKKGCEFIEQKFPFCDLRGSKEGDRCGAGNGTRRICSPDLGEVLTCDDTSLTFVVGEACPKGTHCEGPDSNSARCVPTQQR